MSNKVFYSWIVCILLAPLIGLLLGQLEVNYHQEQCANILGEKPMIFTNVTINHLCGVNHGL